MRIIKNLVITIHILLVIAICYITLNSNHMLISDGFGRCLQVGDYVYFTEDSRSDSVLYKVGTNSSVANLYKSKSEQSQVKIYDFAIADSLYVLEKRGDEYTVKKLSLDELYTISKTEPFTIDGIEGISDFYVNINENSVFITAIANGRMNANVYKYSLDEFISVSDESSEETAAPLPMAYQYESKVGYINAAYYDGSSVITDAVRPLENTRDITEYASNMELSAKQALSVNSSIAVIIVAYAILGAIIILLIFKLIEKRRRTIDLILLNEAFILLAAVFMVVLFSSFSMAILWTVLVSIVNIAVILYENRDIRILCEDMRRISAGNLQLDKPAGSSVEVSTLWRGLNEVKYLYEQYKYIKDTTTAAALRFLPNSIGTIFKCNSLDEIKPGDCVHIPGTFMIYRTRKEITNEVINATEEYEKNTEGTLLTGESTPYKLNMLFTNPKAPVIQSGLDFYADTADDTACSVYYSDLFKMSVVGTASKTILNVFSEQTGIMQDLSKWFFKMEIRMVISEDVKETAQIKSPLRNIGYCYIGGQKKTFYEVLDAYSESIRADRIKCLDDFDNALSLLYKNDFYLARTAFSDILKVDPSDELARWYLFICEKYLNNPDLPDKSCALDPRN